jgi:type II secretory pathway predicted ATPase ExeA
VILEARPMYEEFYGFSCPPFSNIPDPSLFYLSPQHQRDLSLLEYAIMSRAGFCVVTGDVGTGKTTLVRRVLQEVDPQIEVGLVSNTQCASFEEFMQWILLAFDLEYRDKGKVELYDTLVNFLIDRFQRGTPVTLIIDEAQHLGPAYLEQVRMLSNVNTEKGQVLQTILVGQPELWDLLRRPELSQFAQRIAHDCHLGPLESAALVEEYIKHRLKGAGGSVDVFEPATFALIWKATKGIPRLINLVCDTALVYGYAEREQHISQVIIDQVLEDKRSGFAAVGERTARRPKKPNNMLQAPRSATVQELEDDKSLSTIERAARKKPRTINRT